MIRVEELTKVYKMGGMAVEVLRGIDLTVDQGEFVAIIGPSGSGKSTLMNILGCLDVPSSGKYWLNGKEISLLTDNQLAEVRNKHIGFVFQSFNLLPRLSALENVERPLVYRGIGRKERRKRAMEALARVGLKDRMFHRPTQLSGGQQQRVAIARALVGEPALILADEPTGNLDSVSGRDVMKLLTELHAQGRTIVLITHDQGVARQAQRQVKIQDGHIVDQEEGVSSWA
ncbi:ABC transporter ATP-binding protein [Zhaonella formicivorans]|jgi:putative ABC transport system ATP-binding protein|uniref:ABC transporter ATP-binding protein n=1 Tax=Zhaonella formicivorans TaxID=2528593 RepID=UPI0010DD2594|nr:ABC transporter ATP-binding protein [Zhaonella formicivorans]